MNIKTQDLEKILEKDKFIDEQNLVGELREQKDLIYKWRSYLEKVSHELKKLRLEFDRLHMEKHRYYSNDFEQTLRPNDVKIYIAGDKDIIKMKNEINQRETLFEFMRMAVEVIKEKGKTIRELISIQDKVYYS